MIWLYHFIIVTLLLAISKVIKNDKFFIVTSFWYSIFIFGQRWMTGTDFPHYLRYTLVDFQVRDPIYRFLQTFIMEQGLYFGLLVFFIFLLTLFNNYRFIVKLDKHVVFIIYIFLLSEIYFAQLSQIRQFLAVSFFLNAYFNAFNKNYARSFLNIILGTGFHTSIFFLIPFLFIKLNITRIKALYLLIVSAVLPLIDVTLILKIPFFNRYSHYVDSIFNVNLSIFHLFKFYILLFVVSVFILNLKKYRNTPTDQMILHGILFSMLIYGLSFQFAPMIRINGFFKSFEFVFLIYYLNEVDFFSISIKRLVVLGLFMVTYLGFALTDPYNITRYEFRHLRLYEEKTTEQLWEEINNF